MTLVTEGIVNRKNRKGRKILDCLWHIVGDAGCCRHLAMKECTRIRYMAGWKEKTRISQNRRILAGFVYGVSILSKNHV